jgi:hypothetical protein
MAKRKKGRKEGREREREREKQTKERKKEKEQSFFSYSSRNLEVHDQGAHF